VVKFNYDSDFIDSIFDSIFVEHCLIELYPKKTLFNRVNLFILAQRVVYFHNSIALILLEIDLN